MDVFLYIVLGLLVLLACCDLFVGVSNDAVNFLNAAVGSRAAPFWVVMLVASAGVLFGATFSSGMMEVAKTGVFVPEYLSFKDVMVVFIAVMVTDVLLLNLFNSLGLPTSTTVSIIFELLGGSLALAFWKVWKAGAPIADIGLYINSGKALTMIMGILVSVIVAFITGFVVQYLLRILFTFRCGVSYRRYGGILGGAALTAILYFLIMKGAKDASFMREEWIDWIAANTNTVIGVSFVAFTVIMQGAILLFRANVFPFVILSGTFALAFAFAGNDLVNFVGVPLAALDSFELYSAAAEAAGGPVDPTGFMMEGLRTTSRTPTIYLAASGFIMCLTLWFSKKAHRVIRTSVNLSSSSRGGKEQFGSSLPARVIVRCALRGKTVLSQFIPDSVAAAIDRRFEKAPVKSDAPEPAFDELRAVVNLVLAASLIASATSLKLPLSTTYVTFMVAMGSSLADRAWDRESAVYRISGVLTVISGWFLTAFSAATAAGIVASLFLLWGEPAMLVGMVVALTLVVRSNFLPGSEEEDLLEAERIERGDRRSVREILSTSIDENLRATLGIFSRGLEAFVREDAQALRVLKSDAVDLFDRITLGRGEYYRMALADDGTKSDRDARNFYYRAFTNMKEIGHALRDQMGVTENYVSNCHSPFSGRMRTNIILLAKDLAQLRENFTDEHAVRTLQRLECVQAEFLTQIAEEKVSLRKSDLYLGYLVFARECLGRYRMVKLLQTELNASAQAGAAASKDENGPNRTNQEVSA